MTHQDGHLPAREPAANPDLRAYAREAAQRAGCDPDLFERQIQQESAFDPDAYNSGSGATGIAQIVARFHPGVDPHDPLASLDYAARWMAELRRQHGSYRKALAAYNWGPGNVAGWDGQRTSLPAETRHYLDVILGPAWAEPSASHDGTGMTPPGADTPATRPTVGATLHFRVARVSPENLNLRAAPGRSAAVLGSLAESTIVAPLGPARDADGLTWLLVRTPADLDGWVAASFLDVVAAHPQPGRRFRSGSCTPSEPPPGPAPSSGRRYRFDPATPTELQVQSWTCAIRSTMWLLKSIGIAVTAAEAQDRMAPRYVTSEVGLLDASGAGIVEVLRDGWGVSAFNRAPVSFDEVAGWAGRCPVAVGGRAWGHWSAVRGLDDAGRLVLANPGGAGPRYGQQTLDRQQFADLGWFSAVVIPLA